MDTLQALKVAAVVRTAGSFSAAARQLGVTPAAVAKQVAQLEDRLGTRLFDRTTHHLAVTAEGREVLERVATPLRDLQDALTPSKDSGRATGAVKVSVPASFAHMAVIPYLAAFQERYPELRLDLRLENRRVDLVAEGYDCGIGASLAPDSSLVARPLATLRPVLCAAPTYLADRGTPRTLADLAHHRCIALRSDTTGRLRDWDLTLRGRIHHHRPDGALQLTDPEAMAGAAVAGCGIALVGIHHVARSIIQGRLVRVLPDVHGPRFQIFVYYAKRRLLPARTRAFVDHILATVPSSDAFKACHEALQSGGP
jgi:DNA-binding transcriptional LysR family regulator